MVGKRKENAEARLPVCVGLYGALASKCTGGCAGKLRDWVRVEAPTSASIRPARQQRSSAFRVSHDTRLSYHRDAPQRGPLHTWYWLVARCLFLPKSRQLANKASSLLGGIFSDTLGIETCLCPTCRLISRQLMRSIAKRLTNNILH